VLLEEIARGGMGVVYKARQVSLNRVVAVKMILSGQLAGAVEVQRFRQEAEAAAHLQHPNIVAIHEVGEHEGHQYFSMDYVEGRDLTALMREGPLPARRAAALLQTIAEAIHYAHQCGIIHRDLKPSNVLIDTTGQPRLTDFGLAKRFSNAELETKNSELTLTGQVLGTPAYMAPEQASGKSRDVGPCSDIYSLGAIFYELLTGRPPFVAATQVEILMQVVNAEPVSPRLLNPGVPRDLETICLKCLEKSGTTRYPTAGALSEDVGRWLRGETILARPARAPERAAKWVRRNPAWAALWSAMALATLTVWAIVLVKNTQIRHESNRAQLNERTATNALARLQRSERATRQQRYVGDMYFVAEAIERGNIGPALALLDVQTPEPGQDAEDLRGFEWRYFRQRAQDRALRVLTGHAGAVTALTFTPDGRTLMSGDDRGEVRLWDTSGRRPSTWRGGKIVGSSPLREGNAAGTNVDGVAWLSVSPGGESLAISHVRGPVHTWDLGANRFAREISRRGARALFAGRPDLLTVASPDDISRGVTGSVDWEGGREETLPPALRNAGGLVAVSSNFHYLVTAAYSGRVLIWTNGANRAHEFNEAKGLDLLAVSPDGRIVATANAFERKVRLWDWRKNRRVAELEGHTAHITGLAFDPTQPNVATVSADATVRIWDASGQEVAHVLNPAQPTAQRAHAGQLKARYHGHTDEPLAVAYSPNGLYLATGGKDRTIRIWDGRPTTELRSQTDIVPPLVFSADGRQMAARDGSGRLALYQTRYWQRARGVAPTNAIPVFFTPDGKALAVLARVESGDALVLQMLDTVGAAVVSSVSLQESAGTQLSGTAAGAFQLLVVGDGQGQVRVWDPRSGKLLGHMRDFPAGELRLAVSPDGRWLAAAGAAGGLELRPLPTGQSRVALGDSQRRSDFVFTPDSSTLIHCGGDDRIRLVRVPNWDTLTTLQGGGEPFEHLAVSPDGRTLAAAARDGTVTLWSLGTWRELATLDREPRRPRALSFAPDGRVLCLADDRATLWYWRAPSLEELGATAAR
jgi:WD40 repeat protein/tRNA A-37 threonylcarbamoyl transferase component Bud32